MIDPKFYFGLVFSLISSVSSDEDFYQVKACCIYKGPHFNDTEYILVHLFNKYEMAEYNSTRGSWITLSPYAKEVLEKWHIDKIRREAEKSFFCDSNAMHIAQNLGNLTTAPTIKLKTVLSDGKHPAMLMCSAYNFYPKQILLTWLRNGQEVSEGVSYSDTIADGDLYYQMYSHLEYTPVSGETITCKVEHVSLSEPRLINLILDDSLSVEKIQIAVGVCGLLLGLIIFSSGFLYYKKTSAVYNTIDQGQEIINVTNSPEDRGL